MQVSFTNIHAVVVVMFGSNPRLTADDVVLPASFARGFFIFFLFFFNNVSFLNKNNDLIKVMYNCIDIVNSPMWSSWAKSLFTVNQ